MLPLRSAPSTADTIRRDHMPGWTWAFSWAWAPSPYFDCAEAFEPRQILEVAWAAAAFIVCPNNSSSDLCAHTHCLEMSLGSPDEGPFRRIICPCAS